MTKTPEANTLDVEAEVLRRYKGAARAPEAKLCCPIQYEGQYLQAIPREVVEKDYGCGDPSRWIGPGQRVVDLGSGAGKICFILSQKVGPAGQIIGVDFNDDMLALSRKHAPTVAQNTGCDNVRFVKGRIQDLALDLGRVQAWLDEHPVKTVEDVSAFEAECDRLRHEEPLIPTASVDVVVSNCVLNLVKTSDKARLFAEIHRVLVTGGRAVISDIVCDEEPTEAILNDPELWSGCVSGAFREDKFLQRFTDAGFGGLEILARSPEPWRVIDGIEFRSMTVQAYRMPDAPCLDRNQAIVYKGPWRCVCDDDNHKFYRGERMAVCDKTFGVMTDAAGPYAADIIPVPPREDVSLEQAAPFACEVSARRHPRQSKGMDYHEIGAVTECCTEPDTGPAACCSPRDKT